MAAAVPTTLPSINSPGKMPSAPVKTHDMSRVDSNASSDSDDQSTSHRRTMSTSSRSIRPRLGPRQPSGTMIVPADHPEVEIKSETYPPNDARSFSPRRTPQETERMVGVKRDVLQNHANELQSGLNALVEKVESIKSDHDKLARNNNALQDYIGGLTQSMSRTSLTTSSSSGRNPQPGSLPKPRRNEQTLDDTSRSSSVAATITTTTSSPSRPGDRRPKKCLLCDHLIDFHHHHHHHHQRER